MITMPTMTGAANANTNAAANTDATTTTTTTATTTTTTAAVNDDEGPVYERVNLDTSAAEPNIRADEPLYELVSSPDVRVPTP